MPERFSLAGRAWIPVARATGRRDRVRLGDISDPSITHLDTGRADCDTSLSEFLIGLLAIAFGPEDNEDWLAQFLGAPDAATLDKAIAPFADALLLDGEGSRFFQDAEDLAGGATFPVGALFVDAPADHFMVDARYQVLSRAGAALALLTLQTMAPSGGAGHRTSLRGGGPLTTLVVPRSDPTLWQRLWANVPLGFKAKPSDSTRIFPWLVATRTSNPKDKGVETTPAAVARAQAFFGMPRRIRLTFEPNTERLRCDLTGQIDEVIVRFYLTKPWGTNYPSNAWRHPLSPYYRAKKGDPDMFPVHMKESRVGYRDWFGLVSAAGDMALAAESVTAFRNVRSSLIGEARGKVHLVATGYALDNMKPLDFGEARVPLLSAGSGEGNAALDGIAVGMIEAADIVARQLASAVRQALYGENAKVDAGSTVLSAVSARFWAETEVDFYRIVSDAAVSISAIAPNQLADQASGVRDVGSDMWRKVMRKIALDTFDENAPIEDSDPERLADMIAARKFLSMMFEGYGTGGRKLFSALGLSEPQKSDDANGSKRRRAAS